MLLIPLHRPVHRAIAGQAERLPEGRPQPGAPPMILVSVGTFVRGFDELVAAADAACAELCLEGFAQIGHSSVAPRHMDWARFLPEAELRALMRRARVV